LQNCACDLEHLRSFFHTSTLSKKKNSPPSTRNTTANHNLTKMQKKRKRAEAPTNRKEAYDWITNSATIKQLRSLLDKDGLPKIVRRDQVLDSLPITLRQRKDLVSIAREWFTQNEAKRKELAEERYKKCRSLFEEQKQTRHDWTVIQERLRTGTHVFVLVRPAVFHEWRQDRSGPGSWLVHHYEEQKSRYVKAVVLNTLPSFPKKMTEEYWQHVHVSVKLLQNVELESLSPPDEDEETSNKWKKWVLLKDTSIELRLRAHHYWSTDRSSAWNQKSSYFSGYVNHDLACVSWDAKTTILAELLSTSTQSLDISYLVISYLDDS